MLRKELIKSSKGKILRGLFIVFEGIDKTGKTTALKSISSKIVRKGIDILTTFEPGDSQIGSSVRELLLNPEYNLNVLSEFFLFATDRIEHSMKKIKTALENGKIVITDRFHFSTFAYQIYPNLIDLTTNSSTLSSFDLILKKTLVNLDMEYANLLFTLVEPDLIFYFYNDILSNSSNKDIDCETMKKDFMSSKARNKDDFSFDTNDSFEKRGDSFFSTVEKGYQKSFTYYKDFSKIIYNVAFSNGIKKNIEFILEKIIEKYDEKKLTNPID